MSRVIPNTESALLFAAPSKRSTPEKEDLNQYSERLVKFVPCEVLAGYLSVSSQVHSFPSHNHQIIFLLVLVTVCLVAIPIQYRALRPRGKKVWKHVVVSWVAFLVWAYAMGGPVVVVGWHHPGIAGLVLVAFTLLAPLYKP